MKKIGIILLSTLLCTQVTIVSAENLASSSTATLSGNSTNIVKLNPTKVTPKVGLANGSVVDDISAPNMLSKDKTVAAVNGGFFNAYYSSGNTISFPSNCAKNYATIIKDGELINGGGTGITLAGFNSSGNAVIDKVTVKSQVQFNDKLDILVWGVNNHYSGEPTMYFTDEMTLPVEISSNYTNIYIANNKVTKITNGGKVIVPKNTSVLVVPNSIMTRNEGYGKFIAVGDKAVFSYEIEPQNTDKSRWQNVTEAMGGGALLVANGKNESKNNTYSDAKQSPTMVLQRSFIGVTKDGQIVLGEGVTSFDAISNYLIKNGVVEAMALDGGASSMLYANGTYLQSAGRELASVLTFTKNDNTSQGATKTNSKILINGNQVDIPAYTINSTTYFKLRDLAYFLADTNLGFTVGYDDSKSAIVLEKGEYNKNTHQFAINTGVAKVQKSTFPTYVNGKKYDFVAYVIGGNTHYSLRDIGDALGFKVGWNARFGQIEIITN